MHIIFLILLLQRYAWLFVRALLAVAFLISIVVLLTGLVLSKYYSQPGKR